jgi:hypothetical protein
MTRHESKALSLLESFVGGPPPRKQVQRFHLVQRRSDKRYDWISQHREREAAEHALGAQLPGDRVECLIIDLSNPPGKESLAS